MPGLATKAAALDVHWESAIGDHVIGLCWSPGGSRVAAAPVTGPLAIYCGDTGERKLDFAGHGFGTAQVAWSPASKAPVLASCGQDGCIRIWDAAAGRQLAELKGGADWVEHLAWSRTGQYLATAAGRKLRMWNLSDPAQPELLHDYDEHASTIAGIQWKPGADELAACGYNGLTFWSPTQHTMLRRFDWKGSMLTLAWSPDAKYIATGNQDSTVQFWMMGTGKELQMWGYRAKIRELAWDQKSRYLATGGSSVAVVWDCSGKGPSGSKPLLLEFHQRLLTQLKFQEEGGLLASGCDEGLVAVWRPGKDPKPLATAYLATGVSQLAWSPSGRRLAVGTEDGSVQILRAP